MSIMLSDFDSLNSLTVIVRFYCLSKFLKFPKKGLYMSLLMLHFRFFSDSLFVLFFLSIYLDIINSDLQLI